MAHNNFPTKENRGIAKKYRFGYRKLALLCGLFVPLLFLAAGCPPKPQNNVVIPANDGTLPKAGLTVNNDSANLNVDEMSTPADYHSKMDKVSLLAGATDDDGGIKSVKLFTEYTYYKTGQTIGPTLVGSPAAESISTATPGQQTAKNRFVQFNIDLKAECRGYNSIKINAWVEGENFYGGKVSTPQVTILYPR